MQEQRNTLGLSLFKTANIHVSLHDSQLCCPWTEYQVILTTNQATELARIRLEERYFHFKIHSSPAAGYFLSSSSPLQRGGHANLIIHEAIPGKMSSAGGHL